MQLLRDIGVGDREGDGIGSGDDGGAVAARMRGMLGRIWCVLRLVFVFAFGAAASAAAATYVQSLTHAAVLAVPYDRMFPMVHLRASGEHSDAAHT